MDDVKKFLSQNPLTAVALAEYQIPAGAAEHHAGGLYVLGGFHIEMPDLYVKMHDSWGGDDTVVVHTYNPEDETGEEIVEEFLSGEVALARFLELTGRARTNKDQLNDGDTLHIDAQAVTLTAYLHIPEDPAEPVYYVAQIDAEDDVPLRIYLNDGVVFKQNI